MISTCPVSFPNFPILQIISTDFYRCYRMAAELRAWQMLLIVHFADVIQSISSRPGSISRQTETHLFTRASNSGPRVHAS